MKNKNIAKANRISKISDILQSLNDLARFKERDDESSLEVENIIFYVRNLYCKEFSELLSDELKG